MKIKMRKRESEKARKRAVIRSRQALSGFIGEASSEN